jgi:Mn2+/Fe2+ NRAMP family transporter
MLNDIRERSRLVGPGLVWAAAAIGSGEVIIGTKVGAEYGYSFVWALWLGILLKWTIHRGVLDLTVLADQNVLDRWHRLRLGWVSSGYWLVFFLLTVAGLSGLLGLSAAGLNVLIPAVSADLWAVIVAVGTVALIFSQRYQGFEKIMLGMCLVLVISVIGSVLLARPNVVDVFGEWSTPSTLAAGLLLLSLLGWGAGSGPDLILPYSTWVLEKGRTDWSALRTQEMDTPATGTTLERVRQIPRVLRIGRIDLGSGYIVTAFVASGFMIAGAALLNPKGLVVDGPALIRTLSTILTDSYGDWAFGIFIFGVIAALLSTFLGVLDGTYLSVSRLVALLRGVDPATADRRRSPQRLATLAAFAAVPLLLLLLVKQPLTLVIIAGVVSAVSMPVLGLLVLYSLAKGNLGTYRPSRLYLGGLMLAITFYLVLMIISIGQLW